jgi:hypothetical protein
MRSGGHVVFAAAVVLLAGALLLGDSFWVGAAAVVVAGALVAASLAGLLPRPGLDRWGLVAVVLFVAFAVWVGASVLWSAAPDRSWDFFNGTLVYLAFLALGLFVARERLADALAALLGLVVVWALVEKVLALDDGRRARMHEPVGYWNTLGLLAATAVPLALRLRNAVVRALLVYGAVVAVLLTQSRAALLLAVVAAGVWLWVEPARRAEAGWSLVAAVPPAVVVGAFALSLSGIADDAQPESERVSDGRWVGLALLVGAAVVVWVARLEPQARVLRGAALAVVPLLVAAGLFVGVRAVQDFDEPVTPESPSRLGQGSSNNRAQWWEEAARGFGDNPIAGNGAGAFQVTHRRYRESNVEVRQPHSLPLQLLTETGIVGFALLAGAFAAAGLVVWRRQRELVFVVALFVAGTLVDIHWDFLAAGAVAFTALGSLLAVGVRPARRDPWLAAGAAAVAIASLYSLAAPWAADRRLDAAYHAIEDGDLPTAVDEAQRSRSLNPLSVEPLFARGYVEEARGQFDVARDAYATAIEVQPENREAWYRLGRLEFENERFEDAYQRFNRMYALDPHGPHVEWVERSRCRINPTGC